MCTLKWYRFAKLYSWRNFQRYFKTGTSLKKSFQPIEGRSWARPNGANCFWCSPAGGVLITLGRWGCCCCYPEEVGCSWWGKEFGLHYHSDSLLLEGNRDSLQQQFPLEEVQGMWNYLWKSSLQCLRGNRDWKQQNSSHALDLKNRQKGAQIIQ